MFDDDSDDAGEDGDDDAGEIGDDGDDDDGDDGDDDDGDDESSMAMPFYRPQHHRQDCNTLKPSPSSSNAIVFIASIIIIITITSP